MCRCVCGIAGSKTEHGDGDEEKVFHDGIVADLCAVLIRVATKNQ
jgi:hypothetical protein